VSGQPSLPINDPPSPPAGLFPRIPVVCTTDVDEAREAFRGVYADASLEPERTRWFRWAMDLVPCGAVSVASGVWGGATRVVAPMIGVRHILTLSRGGMSEGVHAGQDYTIIPGRSGAMFSPALPATNFSTVGFQARAITIEPGALDAHLTALTGRVPDAPIVFAAALDLEAGPGALVLGVAQLLGRAVERRDASPLTVVALRDALLTALLTGVKHSASRLLEPAPPRVAPGCVKRAEEYIEAHAAEPITLAGIVAAAGVPARSLRAAFTACRGVAPMEFLRRCRYELAQQRLIEAVPGTTVMSVVKALGLGDAGRFSVEYKKRFGHSPSEVLAGGRARTGPSGARVRRA
jgi:AraC-like DNA-binding protein